MAVAATKAASTTKFSGTLASGQDVTIESASDCTLLQDDWLRAWCQRVVSFTPTELPQTAQGLRAFALTTDLERAMDAAFAWAALHQDLSICDMPAVAVYVAAGMHTEDGASACRASLEQALAAGQFSVTSPTSQVNLRVTISVSPSPTSS